jgi:hypothetical protein
MLMVSPLTAKAEKSLSKWWRCVSLSGDPTRVHPCMETYLLDRRKCDLSFFGSLSGIWQTKRGE